MDHLGGVEWLKRVGREAREGNVIVDMQNVDEMRTVRGVMENPKCLWLQVDVSGGGWAPSDTPVVMNDGYVAAGEIGGVEAGPSGAVALPPAPPMALPLRVVAEEFGLLEDDSDYDPVSDVDMSSSPLAARVARRLWPVGGMKGGAGSCAAGPGVGLVVLFPTVPGLPGAGERPLREGTILDSVDGGDSEFGDGVSDVGGFETNDPACGKGSRAGGCEYSCGAELGHLNGKVRKLEDLVRLLIADAGLAGWEETRRVGNLKRKMKVEREVAERDHARKLAAERAAGEER